MYEYIIVLTINGKSQNIKVKANIAEEATFKALRIMYRKGVKKSDIDYITVFKKKWY